MYTNFIYNQLKYKGTFHSMSSVERKRKNFVQQIRKNKREQIKAEIRSNSAQNQYYNQQFTKLLQQPIQHIPGQLISYISITSRQVFFANKKAYEHLDPQIRQNIRFMTEILKIHDINVQNFLLKTVNVFNKYVSQGSQYLLPQKQWQTYNQMVRYWTVCLDFKIQIILNREIVNKMNKIVRKMIIDVPEFNECNVCEYFAAMYKAFPECILEIYQHIQTFIKKQIEDQNLLELVACLLQKNQQEIFLFMLQKEHLGRYLLKCLRSPLKQIIRKSIDLANQICLINGWQLVFNQYTFDIIRRIVQIYQQAQQKQIQILCLTILHNMVVIDDAPLKQIQDFLDSIQFKRFIGHCLIENQKYLFQFMIQMLFNYSTQKIWSQIFSNEVNFLQKLLVCSVQKNQRKKQVKMIQLLVEGIYKHRQFLKFFPQMIVCLQKTQKLLHQTMSEETFILIEAMKNIKQLSD